MLPNLIPSRQLLPADDPIFALNREAQQRAASGELVINATVGSLLDEKGQLVVHECVARAWQEMAPKDYAPYAPIAGDPAFLEVVVRQRWSKAPAQVAVATPGGSGALSLSLKNFTEPGQTLLTAGPCSGPYGTLAREAGLELATAPWPEVDETLDEAAWRTLGASILGDQGRLLVWLNDPCHNPTGRSLSQEDRRLLLGVLDELAKVGPVTLLLDLAYLDYAKDPTAVKDALSDYEAFAQTSSVLVGAAISCSKALTLYGARIGALAFPWLEGVEAKTLQNALSFACRGSFSNAPRGPQSLVIKLAEGTALGEEQRRWTEVLKQRTQSLDASLRHENLPGAPWDGGFFVTLQPPRVEATMASLRAAGAFVVPMREGLRVGVCGLRIADIPRFSRLIRAAW